MDDAHINQCESIYHAVCVGVKIQDFLFCMLIFKSRRNISNDQAIIIYTFYFVVVICMHNSQNAKYQENKNIRSTIH